jgi:hypothetical protein
MQKLRLYSYKIYNGYRILISWGQRRCIKCQRFLSKRELKYCKDCAKTANREQKKLNMKKYGCTTEYREYHNLQTKIYTNPYRYKVGDIV